MTGLGSMSALPREIRDQIYEHVLPSGSFYPYRFPWWSPQSDPPSSWIDCFGILGTSKLANREASEVLYANNENFFAFVERRSGPPPVWTASPSTHNINHMKSVFIEIDMDNLCTKCDESQKDDACKGLNNDKPRSNKPGSHRTRYAELTTLLDILGRSEPARDHFTLDVNGYHCDHSCTAGLSGIFEKVKALHHFTARKIILDVRPHLNRQQTPIRHVQAQLEPALGAAEIYEQQSWGSLIFHPRVTRHDNARNQEGTAS